MTDERLKKIMGIIPTEKYHLIEKILGLSALGSFPLAIVNTIPLVDFLVLLLYMLNSVGYSTMKESRGIDFTKSYLELEQDYNLFLNNYRNLMSSLDINSLASLCSSFYYLYKHGYLSIEGNFSSNNEEYFEGRRFQLVNIFNGCGVCRHKANSIKDILNFCGYPTAGIPVYTRIYEKYNEEDIANMRESLLSLFEDIEEEKLRVLVSDAVLNIELLYHQMDLDKELASENYSEKKKRIVKSSGNHLIVITSYNGESITYDPSDNCFYEFKNKKSYDIINEYGMRVLYRLKYLGTYNTPSEQRILYRNLKLDPMNLVGLRIEQDKAELRLKDNLDMVNRFRKENLPLMQSLRDKAYKLVL